MIAAYILNIVGLTCDICGVMWLIRKGFIADFMGALSQLLAREGESVHENLNRSNIPNVKKRKLAVSLIILGFVLQLFSNFIQIGIMCIAHTP